MKKILKDEVLEFHPDTLIRVREACGLDAPGRMEEAVELLRDWAAKQEHFLKKDFDPIFLEALLLTCKGSVEKAKIRLDLMCTMRTFTPELFVKINVKKDFTQFHKVCKALIVPKLTEDHYRLTIMQITGSYPTLSEDLFQWAVIVNEYLKFHDYSIGHICLVDLREANIFDLVKNINPVGLRNSFTLITKGYGSRIKSINLLTPSRTVESVVSLLKQVLSPKITSRIEVHRNIEEIYERVPKYMLPKDYGGDDISLDKIYDAWMEAYSNEEYIMHLKEMQKAGTDESRRRAALDNSMFGVPGTFRALNVD